MQKLSGKLTISRITSNISGDHIEISIIDALSNEKFVVASMSLDTFAAACTGLGHLDVELVVNNLNRVGSLLKQSYQRLFFKDRQVSYDNILNAFNRTQPLFSLEPSKFLGLSRGARFEVNVDEEAPGWFYVDVPIYWYENVI